MAISYRYHIQDLVSILLYFFIIFFTFAYKHLMHFITSDTIVFRTLIKTWNKTKKIISIKRQMNIYEVMWTIWICQMRRFYDGLLATFPKELRTAIIHKKEKKCSKTPLAKIKRKKKHTHKLDKHLGKIQTSDLYMETMGICVYCVGIESILHFSHSMQIYISIVRLC